MSSILGWLAGGVGVIFFLLIGLVQIVVGYLGIEYHLGSGWAIGLVIASIFFRISFPLTIGTFFGALDVLGWPWYGALILTLPGVLLMVPGAIAMGVAGLISMFKGGNQNEYQRQSSYNYQNEEPINVTPRKSKTKTIKKVTKKKKVAEKKVAKRKSTKK